MGKGITMAISALAATGIPVSAVPVPVMCTASGGKVVALSDAEACARFITALGTAMRQATTISAIRPTDGYAVELRFLPQGIASAKVIRLRRGRAQEMPPFQLAVSDRKMLSSDIDKLAGDAARGIARLAAPEGR
ncbi:hypothetical protein [Sphingomonas sp. SUN039]|uniref:hypothetical protein n=1 Tax=Sphingomonas sp. SUN039 TaxID=2937787 RepID=UPI00216431D6|nr:hypothetical protein [Sphingomonas sp. SUN039]UVO54904.1 hypothetical protein M0209_12500 [Sphingomonas sp. SUN039]